MPLLATGIPLKEREVASVICSRDKAIMEQLIVDRL